MQIVFLLSFWHLCLQEGSRTVRSVQKELPSLVDACGLQPFWLYCKLDFAAKNEYVYLQSEGPSLSVLNWPIISQHVHCMLNVKCQTRPAPLAARITQSYFLIALMLRFLRHPRQKVPRRILTFRDKKWHISMFFDKNWKFLMFCNKKENTEMKFFLTLSVACPQCRVLNVACPQSRTTLRTNIQDKHS